MNKKKGISLLVLIITMIVMIILAGAIILTLRINNPIKNANEAKIKNDMNAIKDEYNSYRSSLLFTSASELEVYDEEQFNVNTDGTIIYEGEVITPDKEILPSIKGTPYEGKVFVAGGQIYLDNRDKFLSSDQKKWAEEVGVKILDKGYVLVLSKKEMIIKIGGKEQLYVNVLPKPETEMSVTFTSDDDNIASVSEDGEVTGVYKGETKVIASIDDEDTSDVECDVKVVNKTYVNVDGITIDPNSIEIKEKEVKKINAIVTPDNAENKNVKWSTEDSSIATVDSYGYVTGVKEGTTTVTATTVEGKFKANCTVRVRAKTLSITLNKEKLTLRKGVTEQLTATVTPSSNQEGVIWSSSDESIATVDQQGKVYAKGIGNAVITAMSYDKEKSATCSVEVIDPLTLTAKVLSQENDTVVLDINSNTTFGKITTISITAKEQGTSTVITKTINVNDTEYNNNNYSLTELTPNATYEIVITSTIDDGSSKTVKLSATPKKVLVESVTLDKKETSIYIGNTETLTATVNPNNAYNKELTWSSSKKEVATVDANGTITPVEVGVTDITVQSKDDPTKQATCKVTVMEPITFEASVDETKTTSSSILLKIKASTAVGNLTKIEIQKKKSDESVYTTSGTVPITDNKYDGTYEMKNLDPVTTYNIRLILSTSIERSKTVDLNETTKKIDVTKLTLDKNEITLEVNDTAQLTATIEPPNATNQGVKWSTDNEEVATVDQTGKVTAVKDGSATITATSEDDSTKQATCTVTVNKPVAKIGSKHYSKLQDAFNAVTGTSGSPTQIDLLDKVTENTTFPENKYATLIMGSKTIDGTLTNNGNLTFSGTGTITNNSANAIVNNGGTLTINGQTITAESNSAIEVKAGTVNVTNGTVNNSSTTNATVNITGGTFTLGSTTGEIADTPTITNGAITGTTSGYGVKNNSGIFNFNNGSVVGFKEAISGNITVGRSSTDVIYSKSGSVETASLGTAVAKIEDTSKCYAKLQQAFDEISSGTITLLKSTEENLNFANGKTATLKTGNSSLTINGTLTNSGNLTINGNGTITSSTSDSTLTNNANSTLTLGSSVKIENTGSNGRTINNSGTVKIEGATITKNGSGYEAIYNTGTLTMNSGAISTEGSSSNAIEINSGAVTVNGGTISSNSSGSSYATVYVLSGGTFNLGNSSSSYDDTTPKIKNTNKSSTAYGVYNTGKFNFGNGSVVGYNEAIGGTITVTNTSAKDVVYSKSGSVETAKLGTAVAKIEPKKYEKLQDAFNVASSSTIELLKDTAETLTFESGKTATLSMGSNTITGTLTNKGSLTINESGTITTNSDTRTITNTSGTLTLNGPTVTKTNTSNEVILNNGGTLNMKSGTVSATTSSANAIEISSGAVTVSGGSVSNSATGSTYATVYITGGTFTLGSTSDNLANTPQVKNGITSSSSTAYGVQNTSSGSFYFYNGSVIGDNEAIYGTVTNTRPSTYVLYNKSGSIETATLGNTSEAVAKIGNKYYTTLQKAFDVATSSSTTIELLKNTQEALTFGSGKSATLKTGNYTITGTLINNGTLTIGGSGTITTNSTSSSTITNNSSATLTLNSPVQVQNTGSSGRALNNSGTVTISGATITKTGASYEAIYNNGGILTMTDGNISTTGSSSNAIEVYSGTVTINGGNVSSLTSGSTYATVYINGSSATFNLGNATAAYSSNSPKVKNTNKSSTAYGVYNSNGKFNFGNGSVVGYIESIGGTITATRTSANDVLYSKSTDNVETATLGIAVASIGNKKYAKLQDAFNVASSSTINLLKSTSESSLTFASGKSATLNTGSSSYTITGALTNSGTLTISGNGTITNSTSSSNTITNNSNSSLTLNSSVKIENTGSSGRALNNSGTVTISGATLTKTNSNNETIYNNGGTLTMSSGSVLTTGSSSNAIEVYSGTVNVTGGTVSSSNSSSATVYINSSNATFTLGTSSNSYNLSTPIVQNNNTAANSYGVNRSSGTFNFYDGKVIGYTSAISGGVSSTYTNYAVSLSKSGSVETAILVEAVARIGSTYYYATLQEAFNASSTSSNSLTSITLLKNTTETLTFGTSSQPRYATLSMNSKTITGTLTNNGSLTITGSGTITTNSGTRTITNTSGTLTLNGPTVTKTNTSNEVIYNNGGTLKMLSGTVSTTASSCNAIEVYSGTVTITGGTISNSYSGTSYATVYINGSNATFNLGDSATTYYSNSPKVQNNYRSSTAYGVYRNSGNFYFYNGSIVGYSEAIGGSVTGYRSSTNILYSKSSNIETAILGTAVAHINSKYFATLNDAFSYVTGTSSSQTSIYVDKDISGTTSTFSDTSYTRYAKLYLNGHKISASSSSPVITNKEYLTIYGSGTISNSSGNAISNMQNLTVTSSTGSPTITTSSTSYAAVQNTGTMTVSSGTISSTGSKNSTNYAINNSATKSSLTINNTNANIKSDYSGSVYNYGAITMSNGKISSTRDDGIKQYSGDITITGGEVSGNYGISPYGSTNNCGTVTLGINDGGVPSTTSPRIYGESYAMTPANKFTQLNFYDGKVEFSKEMAAYGTPIYPPPRSSNYNTNPIKTPTGYEIVLSNDGTTYTLGKLTPITSKVQIGSIINYPTLNKSVSITDSSYHTGIIETQTFSTNGSKIKCVVIRNENNIVEIVPLEGQYLALFGITSVRKDDDKKFDAIAEIYNNPTYSQNSYHIGSSNRTTYTAQQDVEAIYNVYKNNTTGLANIYPTCYEFPYYAHTRYDSAVNLNSSSWQENSNLSCFWTSKYYSGMYSSEGYYIGTSDGKYSEGWLTDDEDAGDYNYGKKARIMPIIRLKTTIGITSGSGTTSSPYELGS